VSSLEFLMRDLVCEVWIARDGSQALRLAESLRPDLVLLDVMMPEKSGFEVCRSIRENPDLRDMKIVMLTAKGGHGDQDRGMEIGANAYVTKPFSTKELMRTVRALLPATAPEAKP
jgi:two-component system, OmpR family, alkaline phosphatase synthesis response regulator PhoP